jgi:hypothetical protein
VFDDFGDIGRVGIHVVSVRSLGRAAMAAAVVCDHAIAVRQKEHHLAIPVVGTQRPAMVKEQRLAVSPILVEDFRAVFGRDGAHRCESFRDASSQQPPSSAMFFDSTRSKW